MSDPQFSVLAVDRASRETSLMGYPLKLTASEYAIVAYLSSSCGNAASRSELCELCGASSLNVHICNLNKKATALSGRKLVIFDGKCYKINDKM